RIEALRLADRTVQPRDGLLNVLRDRRAAFDQAGEPSLVRLLIAIADRHRLLARLVARRQVTERGHQAYEVAAVRSIDGQPLVEHGRERRENSRILSRVDREKVLVVAHGEAAVRRIELESKLALLEDASVGLAENRDENAIAHRRSKRAPIH